MTDIFSEIMNDVRADRIERLWNQYGKMIIYLAIVIIATTAAAVYLKHHQHKIAMEMTAHYFLAADYLAKGNGKEAENELNKINSKKDSSYNSLVLLKRAESARLLEQKEEENKILSELATHEDIYGNIAKITLGNIATQNKIKSPEQITEEMPLGLTLKEFLAWEILAKGDKIAAADVFKSIADESYTSETLRDRAYMMSLYLNNSNAVNEEKSGEKK